MDPTLVLARATDIRRRLGEALIQVLEESLGEQVSPMEIDAVLAGLMNATVTALRSVDATLRLQIPEAEIERAWPGGLVASYLRILTRFVRVVDACPPT
jgi:hypothetical protein